MHISNGKFDNPEEHHQGWFRVFHFRKDGFEIWFGNTYWTLRR